MSDDKIAEIKERHFHDERWRNGPSMLCPQMHDDRAFLLAEDARHRAENEKLRADNERLRTEALELARGLGKADAKVALLSRDYDDARAALKGIDALNPDVPDALAADALRVVVAQMGDLARNALEVKP